MARRALIRLLRCALCGDEWADVDLNAAKLCPGCVEDLSVAPEPAPDPAEYAAFRAREADRARAAARERQRLHLGRALELPYAGVRP